MSDSGVRIVKVGAESSSSTPSPVKVGGTRKRHEPQHKHKQPKHGVLKGGKTARAKTKIQGVRDPAKSPPTRKGVLKLLTEKGVEKRRAQIRKTVRNMPDSKVRHILKASGLPVSPSTPPEIARNILEGGMEAGMIVSG